MRTNKSQAHAARKGNKLTLNNQINDQHLRPFCEQSEQAVKHKQRADEEKPYAAKKMEAELAEAHPKCITHDFVIAYMK